MSTARAASARPSGIDIGWFLMGLLGSGRSPFTVNTSERKEGRLGISCMTGCGQSALMTCLALFYISDLRLAAAAAAVRSLYNIDATATNKPTCRQTSSLLWLYKKKDRHPDLLCRYFHFLKNINSWRPLNELPVDEYNWPPFGRHVLARWWQLLQPIVGWNPSQTTKQKAVALALFVSNPLDQPPERIPRLVAVSIDTSTKLCRYYRFWRMKTRNEPTDIVFVSVVQKPHWNRQDGYDSWSHWLLNKKPPITSKTASDCQTEIVIRSWSF